MRMKDVIISVTGVQQGVNGPDAMELVTAGQYGQDEKETLLTWQESELTGMEGTKTSLCVQPRSVVLSREGTLNTRMEFEEGAQALFPVRNAVRLGDDGAEHPAHRQPSRRARRRDRDRLQRGYGRYDRRPQPVFHPRAGAAPEPYQRCHISQLSDPYEASLVQREVANPKGLTEGLANCAFGKMTIPPVSLRLPAPFTQGGPFMLCPSGSWGIFINAAR